MAALLLPGVVFAQSAGASATELSWYHTPAPDQADWSSKRKAGYASVVSTQMPEPAAVLSIPALSLVVPVFGDTHRQTLERGAGWVSGSARVGDSGNLAIAGHRDSFFRPLERIEKGAIIRLRTAKRVTRYRVTSISIVDPLDVSVLEPTTSSVLTLITCYPFRYRGFAPDRYIVRAELDETPQFSQGSEHDSAFEFARPVALISATR